MEQKSILITGITTGMGHVVFKRCLEERFQITAVIRQESQREQLKNFLNENVNLIAADLADHHQVKTLTEKVKDNAFDYVLLNAGCSDTGLFHELEDSSIDQILQTNLISNMHIVHALLPKALEQKTKFIFVSSLAARMAGSSYASYCASKAGLSHFYNCLKREYPSIPFLCIEIGPVDTPLHDKAKNKVNNKTLFRSQEEIGNKMYEAMIRKTGVRTLYWPWHILRRIVMMVEE